MEGNQELMKYDWIPVVNIRQLRIGDIVCNRHTMFPMFVVAVFADAGTLGWCPADNTGTVYADFADNPGDVVEFNLEDDELLVDTNSQKNQTKYD